ncbi:MAG: hypothetical protein LBN23_06560 [Paludibacter sp.]|jgi:hypothetical protein|nr:hypothetical protein [Paludibacter sp.]
MPDVENQAYTPMQFSIAAADDETDNLAGEYKIVNISVFLADANSNTISDKFVHQSFTSITSGIQNCKSVNLPLDPTIIPRKDVYVIANFADNAALQAISTVDDIKRLKTPQITNTQTLDTIIGLPMYGESRNVNLSIATAAAPAQITLIRACAKLRITLTFPDASWLGTNSNFVIENAAPYTYFVKNDTANIAQSAFVNYQPINFTAVSAQQFVGIAYVYEASVSPRLHIFTTIDGARHNYTASSNFPLPVRNYLYDIDVQILKSAQTVKVRMKKHTTAADDRYSKN